MTEYRRRTRVLQLCDDLRQRLRCDGFVLEDTPDGTIWKTIDKEELKAEEEEKKRKEEEKRAKEEETRRMEKEREEKAKIDPKTMFLGMTDLYSQFDENVGKWQSNEFQGIPTLDVEGKPLTKSTLKKVMKLYKEQEKRYTAWKSRN